MLFKFFRLFRLSIEGLDLLEVLGELRGIGLVLGGRSKRSVARGSLKTPSISLSVAGIHLSSLDTHSSDPSQWIARDDVKGGVLPIHLVKSARAREIEYLAKLKVYYTVLKESI